MPFWRKKLEIDDPDWDGVVAAAGVVARLDPERRARLRALTEGFLAKKSFEACGGLGLTPEMSLRIAAQACVPILELGLECYRRFSAVLVYPGEFRSKWSFEDEHGIVTEEDRPLAGEAWADGPVVLSWDDVEQAGDGYNVVIHECAHKLDALTGDEDGVPPGVDREPWLRDLVAAAADLERRDADGEETSIDPYAADSPAEAFAVFSEVFFETPAVLALDYPTVYDRLAGFYRM